MHVRVISRGLKHCFSSFHGYMCFSIGSHFSLFLLLATDTGFLFIIVSYFLFK